MCVPFAWMNEHVQPLSVKEDWIGSIDPDMYGYYVDYGLLLVFGGIPWQVSPKSTSVLFFNGNRVF